MRFFVGTSGYGYREWLGKFYPKKMRNDEMPTFYAQHFPTVEINHTFRELPETNTLETWTSQVPAKFRFGLKAPQRITHHKRLKSVKRETSALIAAASKLGKCRGPLLFQLPPNFKKDLPRLSAFFDGLGKGTKAAIEFRHPSWFDDEVNDCLRTHSCALCVADADDLPTTDFVRTTNWGYVRLRRDDYDDRALRRWIRRLRDQQWKEVYVFFRHEETGSGPRFATRFLELATNAQ